MARMLVIPFFIPHEGCPFTCVFCNQWKISGQREEARPEDMDKQVNEYLHTVKEKPDKIEIAFFGGSFTGIPIEKQEAWLKNAAELKDKKLITGIRLSTRPDYIDEDILKRLLYYGVTTIELGVQSLVNEVLEKSCRGYTCERVFDAAERIRKYPFDLIFQLMLGLPGDNYDTAHTTAVRTVLAKPEGVRIYPAVVLKGTEMARWYEDKKYMPWTLAQAIEVGSEWLGTFLLYKIRVIRMGLQASDNLDLRHDLAAGPYHPAYGELVESRLMMKQIETALDTFDKSKKIDIYFNPRDYSKVVGQKRSNLKQIQKKTGTERISLIPDKNLAKNNFSISTDTKTIYLSRDEFLKRYFIGNEIN